MATFRSRVAGLVLLLPLVALASGALLTLAAAARRTASAPSRFTSRASRGIDAAAMQADGPPATRRLAELPSVQSVWGATFLFAALGRTQGTEALSEDAVDSFVFAGTPQALIAHLVRGRWARRTDEFVATQPLADALGIGLGGRAYLNMVPAKVAAERGFTPSGMALGAMPATLVGIVDSPSKIDDPTPLVLFPTSLLTEQDVGAAATPLAFRLRPGRSIADLRREVASLDGVTVDGLGAPQLLSSTTQDAVSAQAQALWALTAVVGIAVLVIVGQVLARQSRLAAEDRLALEAMGFTPRQRILEPIARALVPILAAIAVAVPASIAGSRWFPTGLARRVEPDPGVRVDPAVLIAGVVVLVSVWVAWVAAAAALADRREGRAPSWRSTAPGPLADLLIRAAPSRASATGIGFASRSSACGTVLGLGLAVLLLAGTLTFGSSLDRLLAERWRYGDRFDFSLSVGQNEISPGARRTVAEERAVRDLTEFRASRTSISGQSLPLIGYRFVRGRNAATVLEGRLPSTRDEVALGRRAARAVRATVGDDVTFDPGDGRRAFRVSGIVAMPVILGNDQLGNNALVTMETIPVDPSAPDRVDEVMGTVGGSGPRKAAMVKRVTARALGIPDGVDVGETMVIGPPVGIVNVRRIQSSPLLLLGVLALLAALGAAFVVWTAVGRRARDHAVLRALGGDRRLVGGVARWQGVAAVTMPLLVGLPLGIVSGARVFRAFANGLGVVHSASVPVLLSGAVLAGGIVLAAITATASVWSRRAHAMKLLRTE